MTYFFYKNIELKFTRAPLLGANARLFTSERVTCPTTVACQYEEVMRV